MRQASAGMGRRRRLDRAVTSFFFYLFPLTICPTSWFTVAALVVVDPTVKTYRYFCYGSNVLPDTMTKLRGIKPLDGTAAVLPGYQLRFDGSEGSRFEPSAAFVLETKNPQDRVHGVLYTLTPQDFATVGSTEGVPFGYRWKRCQVIPYVGVDGEDIGNECLDLRKTGEVKAIDAITLISPKSTIQKDIPPSSSYLGIIQDGAKFWKLDASYQAMLASIPTAQNLIIPGGLSGPLLRLAVLLRKQR